MAVQMIVIADCQATGMTVDTDDDGDGVADDSDVFPLDATESSRYGWRRCW